MASKKKIGLDLSGAVDRLVDKKGKKGPVSYAPYGRKKGMLGGLIKKFGNGIWAGTGGSDVERGSRPIK